MPQPYADLVARLASYLQAEARILQSQEYAVGQGGAARRNRRAELADVQAQIKALQLDIEKHPDNPANTAGRGPRRLIYLRPR
jgi:hypothetical protein